MWLLSLAATAGAKPLGRPWRTFARRAGAHRANVRGMIRGYWMVQPTPPTPVL